MVHFSASTDTVSRGQFPSKVIIIGAGVFGLSTALAIATRHPSTAVCVVDRLTPPVEDGTSVDTTRCIRSDYEDPIYARLAKTAHAMIQADPELRPYLFQKGMNYICDGKESRFTDCLSSQLALAKRKHPEDLVELATQEEVYQRIHGRDTHPKSEADLGRSLRWVKGYCNIKDCFIDAKAGIQVYYDRCLRTPSITFMCGSAVDTIDIVGGEAKGVTLENGITIKAEMIVVAAGAWSPRLVNLGSRLLPIGIEVVWFKVTKDEEERWKNMSISTNETTGLNIFPPYKGEIKVLRRSPGYINTVTIKDPDDGSKKVDISYPRTSVSNPTDVIPADAEVAIRNDLAEIMPALARRPLARSKICWISSTPTADFLIAPHPSVSAIHLATGGSAHAWKFLPILGDFVVDSLEGILDKALVKKWAFEGSGDRSDRNAPRIDGSIQELGAIVRSSPIQSFL